MNVGVVTSYPYPIGFNHGVLRFCTLAPEYGIKPILIVQTLHPETDNPMVLEGRRLGLQVETLHERYRFDPRIFPALVGLVDRFNLQLLDLQTYKPLALGLYAKSLRRKTNLVSWVHGFTREDFKVRMYGRIEMILHRFSDMVISVSEPFSDMLVKNGVSANKVTVVPNAVDLEEFDDNSALDELREEYGISVDAKIIGAVGRLSPEKGHTFLISAWREVITAFPSAKLVIVGDGPCMKDLKLQVKNFGLDTSVVFTGFRSDGRRFFSLFDVFVLPSLEEGLPYVLLEAMIQNVPVVATNVGEIPNVLEKGNLGKMVVPGDVTGIAKSVTEILEEKDENSLLAQKAKDSVIARYSHSQRTKAIVGVYGRCSI